MKYDTLRIERCPCRKLFRLFYRNAYLSLLENDKIKKPSASVLYKLSSLYKIDMTDLLIASGIVKADPNYKSSGPFTKKIHKMQKLTQEEETQLLQYLKFLRSKK